MKWDYVGQGTALTADKPVAIQELAHSGQRCRANQDTARAEDQLPTSTIAVQSRDTVSKTKTKVDMTRAKMLAT